VKSLRSIVVLLFCLGLPAGAETVRIVADRDATLVETVDGSLANGSGPAFFAGRTSQGQDFRRRALLHFDVAGSLPRGAVVERVALTLSMNPSNPQPRELRLHRVFADWSEGPASAGGGGGAPSQPGDATWIHTSYDDEFWRLPGGQFSPLPSARRTVSDAGAYSWREGRALVRDVRLWLAAPQRNFGWILIGDESTPTTSKSFASREHPDATRRPVLEVTYRLPGRR